MAKLARTSARSNQDAAEKVIIGKQAKTSVRVPDGDYLAQFVEPTRFARGGKSIEQDVWLIEPDVIVPLYANIPKNDITPASKIGQVLIALGIPADEDFCTDTLMGRRCWVRVRAARYTVALDEELERRTKVLLPEDRRWSRVDRVIRAARSGE
jgi:hypothetical protein